MTNPAPSILGPTDPSTSEMNTFKSFVTVLADVNAKDDIKLKAAQELIKSFEVSVIPWILLLYHNYKIVL